MDTYYYCTNSKRIHKKKPKGTNDTKLTDIFANLFKQIQIPEKDLQWIVQALKESHSGKKEFTKQEIEHYRKEIDKYQSRIENAYEDKLDGSITQELYDKYRKEWSKEKQKYQDKLDKLNYADEKYYSTASQLLELASRSYELFMGSEPEQKRQIISLTLQNLKMKNGKRI